MSRSSPYGILVVALSSVVVAVILFKWIPIWSWKTKPANPHHDVKLIVEEHGEDFTADYMFDAKSL